MRVPDWLGRTARVHPDRPALVEGPAIVSYVELDASVARLAGRLRAAGVTPATRVGACLPNGRALVELIHAVPRAGATIVLLDPRLAAAERARQAAHARVLLTVGETTPLPDAPPIATPALDLDAPHTVIFTSGTSGTPKGVVLTAGNHLWSAMASACHLGHRDDDRWLACLPLTHVGGLAIVLRAVVAGTTVVLHPRFDAAAVARALVHDRITLTSLVPTTLARVLDVLEAPPTTLRCVLVGGAGASAELLDRAAGAGLPVTPTYGLTEAASQVATALPGDRSLRPLVSTSVRIVGDEIQVRGPTMSPGYLDADGGVRPATPDGWLPTGDRGVFGGDGGLIVHGRRDDVIVTGGENVDPATVEAALQRHPAVAEAAVAAIADPEWGHVVGAWIVVRGDAAPTLAQLRETCRGALAPHQLPRRLTVVDVLPRTASGKVRRAVLRS